jgi:hypothetical protein
MAKFKYGDRVKIRKRRLRWERENMLGCFAPGCNVGLGSAADAVFWLSWLAGFPPTEVMVNDVKEDSDGSVTYRVWVECPWVRTTLLLDEKDLKSVE